jgi:hypothetical protein
MECPFPAQVRFALTVPPGRAEEATLPYRNPFGDTRRSESCVPGDEGKAAALAAEIGCLSVDAPQHFGPCQRRCRDMFEHHIRILAVAVKCLAPNLSYRR